MILDRLIEQLKTEIHRAVQDLARNPTNLDKWLQIMARLLTRFALAAFMVGSNKTELSEKEQEAIQQAIQQQLEYLGKFGEMLRRDFRKSGDWQDAWASRAESYANSLTEQYWAGKTQGLPLPSLPGDGLSQCLGNCRCSISVKKLEGRENYDVFWVLAGGDKDRSCQTCRIRARKWSPLKIRDGRVIATGEGE